jgi:uncharacterized protein (TIGR02996 family)
MSDREGLFQAVLANPEDDTPRLVLADYLEEQGNEADAARARVIRLQCEAARLEEEGVEEERRQALEEAADRLVRKHKATMLAGLPVGGGFAIYFRRGFPERAVARTVRDYLKRADAAFAAAPVRSLSISKVAPKDVPALAASEHLARVSALHLDVEEAAEAAPAMLRALGASPHVAGIRELGLFGWYARRTDWPALVVELAAGRWRNVRRLETTLTGDLTAAAVRTLAGAKAFAGLTHLSLTSERWAQYSPTLRTDAVAALANGFPQLRRWALNGDALTPESAPALCDGSRLARLRVLDVRHGHKVTDARALAGLVTASRLKELAVLRLSASNWTWQKKKWAGFAEGLAVPCRAPTLRVLDLSQNPLTGDDVAALVRWRAVRGLLALKLGETAAGPDGAEAIAAAPWERLRALDLWQCGIDTRGAVALAGSRALAGLEWLSLQDNPLGPDGVMALARSPHLTRLRHLNLAGTELDAAARAALRERFGRKKWVGERFTAPEDAG